MQQFNILIFKNNYLSSVLPYLMKPTIVIRQNIHIITTSKIFIKKMCTKWLNNCHTLNEQHKAC